MAHTRPLLDRTYPGTNLFVGGQRHGAHAVSAMAVLAAALKDWRDVFRVCNSPGLRQRVPAPNTGHRRRRPPHANTRVTNEIAHKSLLDQSFTTRSETATDRYYRLSPVPAGCANRGTNSRQIGDNRSLKLKLPAHFHEPADEDLCRSQPVRAIRRVQRTPPGWRSARYRRPPSLSAGHAGSLNSLANRRSSWFSRSP